jgi:ABC-type sugar transport system permease subunit
MMRQRGDGRLAWAFIAPAIGTVALIAVFPILWTFWESLHLHDLRMPWLGRPFVGGLNYAEALSDPRLRDAAAHTAFFAAVTVTLELVGGLALALLLHGAIRARGLARTAALLPWAVPTVVVALIWRFMFESPFGLATTMAAQAGIEAPTWFASATAAWIPLLAADVWKMTPFVAILLLAGLQQIDPALYEAAAMDGAGAARAFREITLPLLRPALVVALLFRTLDAIRVFDVIYVMTGGGPGSATESIAVLTFTTLLQNLRFGYASALSIIVFVAAFVFALAAIRVLGGESFVERRA